MMDLNMMTALAIMLAMWTLFFWKI